jgi:fibronectin-binding autotransporter adhesin
MRVCVALVMLFAIGCAQNSIGTLGLGAGCTRTADCLAGTFCIRGSCQAIACASNDECAGGELCTSEGCLMKKAEAVLQITDVSPTGAGGRVDGSNAIVITGEGFATLDAVQLIAQTTGETLAELVVSNANATSITAALPQSLATGAFPILGAIRVVTFASGSTTMDVKVLQGEAGAAGATGPTGPPAALMSCAGAIGTTPDGGQLSLGCADAALLPDPTKIQFFVPGTDSGVVGGTPVALLPASTASATIAATQGPTTSTAASITIYGESQQNNILATAVAGYAVKGVGVGGSSSGNVGVFGSGPVAGVEGSALGADTNTDAAGSTGVWGTASKGFGVRALTTGSGTGLLAQSTGSGPALRAVGHVDLSQANLQLKVVVGATNTLCSGAASNGASCAMCGTGYVVLSGSCTTTGTVIYTLPVNSSGTAYTNNDTIGSGSGWYCLGPATSTIVATAICLKAGASF